MINSVVESAGVSADLKRARRRQTPALESLRLDRLPPHSLEAEQGVLGCILLAPNPGMGESLELLHGNPEVFYDLRHQTIYRMLVEMFDQQQPIDLITLQQRSDTQPRMNGNARNQATNWIRSAVFRILRPCRRRSSAANLGITPTSFTKNIFSGA